MWNYRKSHVLMAQHAFMQLEPLWRPTLYATDTSQATVCMVGVAV